MSTDWEPGPEDEYLEYLAHERHMYAWCLVRYGEMEPAAAADLAAEFYRYEPPTEIYRQLVFHDTAWDWAMHRLFGDQYWISHPDLASASEEYQAEEDRLDLKTSGSDQSP